MLRQFSSSHDNGQSMVIHSYDMQQRSEHGNISLVYETAPSVVMVK